jgi:hypothetical protein
MTAQQYAFTGDREARVKGGSARSLQEGSPQVGKLGPHMGGEAPAKTLDMRDVTRSIAGLGGHSLAPQVKRSSQNQTSERARMRSMIGGDMAPLSYSHI